MILSPRTLPAPLPFTETVLSDCLRNQASVCGRSFQPGRLLIGTSESSRVEGHMNHELAIITLLFPVSNAEIFLEVMESDPHCRLIPTFAQH